MFKKLKMTSTEKVIIELKIWNDKKFSFNLNGLDLQIINDIKSDVLEIKNDIYGKSNNWAQNLKW